MKKIIFLLLMMPVMVKGQIYFGPAIDSITFTFTVGDSLIRHVPPYLFGVSYTENFVIDTTATTLWQIGRTLKPVFTNDTIYQRGIMTDTQLNYPANANAYFILKIDYLPNYIVDIWHKYETDRLLPVELLNFLLTAELHGRI